MIRFVSQALDTWFKNENRKPMVLRGARQVGKTWIVRELAKRNNIDLVEINFERSPDLADLFSPNDPIEIIRNIEAGLAVRVDRKNSILFLDEIQAVPELFSKLRWFKEEMPELPVIAAGSLVELAIGKKQFSMPVGRITFYHLEQLSFFEFLKAIGNDALLTRLTSQRLGSNIPTSLHQKCLNLFRDYCLIGGMPEVVREWVNSRNMKSCLKIQQDLLATYRDDFHKYGGRIEARLLSKLMLSITEQIGNKFIYSQVDPSLAVVQTKNALNLLSQAKVCTPVIHTTGNSLPLGAQSNRKHFKMIFLDVGLVSAQLGLNELKQSGVEKMVFSNKGSITEQFVGQQFRTIGTPLNSSQLYYWQRTGGRLGEVDYLIQHGNRIIPIEVKAGSAGRMKSLHQFMAEKRLDLAARCYSGQLTLEEINLKTTQSIPVSYKLLSIPHYLVELLPVLIDQVE